MKKSYWVLLASSWLAGFAIPLAAATTVPIKGHSPANIESGCKAEGDVYFAPSQKGVYGCLKANGNLVVCGGVGKYAGTCTVAAAPPRHRGRVATQAEVMDAQNAWERRFSGK